MPTAVQRAENGVEKLTELVENSDWTAAWAQRDELEPNLTTLKKQRFFIMFLQISCKNQIFCTTFNFSSLEKSKLISNTMF